MRTLSVTAIREGTVIDHIPAGKALLIIQCLGLSQIKHQITIGMNLPSQQLGTKDIIKIEKTIFTDDQANQITLFAPSATINIIENFAVVKKFQQCLPEYVSDVLICPNRNCITHNESIKTHFFVESFRNTTTLQCKYCEKKFDANQGIITHYDNH